MSTVVNCVVHYEVQPLQLQRCVTSCVTELRVDMKMAVKDDLEKRGWILWIRV